MNWKRYWSTYPAQFGRTEYLRQVKNTISGKPVPVEVIRATIERVCERLDLKRSDTLLDLCCGNGVVTKALAARCSRVVGVDFSPALVDIATSDHAAANAEYVVGDVRNLLQVAPVVGAMFDKILMIAGLQYMQRRDLTAIPRGINALLSAGGVALLTSIPDRARRAGFYNTPARRIRNVWERLMGSDQMGTWWDRAFIERVCARHGLRCEFYGDDAQATGYRFDVKITRNPRA